VHHIIPHEIKLYYDKGKILAGNFLDLYWAIMMK